MESASEWMLSWANTWAASIDRRTRFISSSVGPSSASFFSSSAIASSTLPISSALNSSTSIDTQPGYRPVELPALTDVPVPSSSINRRCSRLVLPLERIDVITSSGMASGCVSVTALNPYRSRGVGNLDANFFRTVSVRGLSSGIGFRGGNSPLGIGPKSFLIVSRASFSSNPPATTRTALFGWYQRS
jgi:hypothetical protein